MATLADLQTRSGGQCELCKNDQNLQEYTVSEAPTSVDASAYLCATCVDQLTDLEQVDPNHWRVLNDSMWSEVAAVQVLSYRMLHHLIPEGWTQALIEMMYLDEETLAWAKAGIADANAVKHVDSNGVELLAGDTVVLIKDLNVKGGGFTAKRGTAVRRISLVADNPNHIEGKVNDQRIVLLTQYVKKSK